MKLRQINEYTWEIPKQGDMKVPAVIYSSSSLIEGVTKDRALDQARNMACLSGIQKAAYVMPDAHQGYGFPIGGVAGFDMDQGIISPGGVGYDINCGVRLLRTDFNEKELSSHKKVLIDAIFNKIPTGVGKGRSRTLKGKEIKQICIQGARWVVEKGYGVQEDLERTEEQGCIKPADPGFLSSRAISRGSNQLGSLGSGNHFLELQKVTQIYDSKTAETFGINSKDQILVMIHCGSRGLGHQVASDYIKLMEKEIGTQGLPDRQLVNAPIQSKLGEKYYKAMNSAVNFAFANRQMIAHLIREVFENVLGTSGNMKQVYDVCHNVAKFEDHKIKGKNTRMCIHRKGATRSFGPGHKEIPNIYRHEGQPVLIPGSMGTSSYVLVGTQKAEQLSFSSTAHGAGRVMSRRQALRSFRGEKIKKELESRGIELRAAGWKSVAEEASQVYKDVDEVVRVSDSLGIGKSVVKADPIAVIKG
ncbi:MAG: RNA-splicing ligase RtcB [Candidatus Aminicenantes bacterium]|nr:RNA-splicing ligase RtcB [Candidatus Aminicenantes bacterium]